MRKLFFISLLCLFASALYAETEKQSDPFDYNFCGGERVYPIIGINFSTSCGPRNQLALGRRGKLMWFFPKNIKKSTYYKGNYKLSKEQLIKLSTLAEVAKITDNPEANPSKILYKMGINFSARQPKYIYSEFTQKYTPSNELFRMMLRLVPSSEKPNLPDCDRPMTLFDPTMNFNERNDINTAIISE